MELVIQRRAAAEESRKRQIEELLAIREQLLEELYIREKEVEFIEAGKGVVQVAIDPQEFVAFKSRHPLGRAEEVEISETPKAEETQNQEVSVTKKPPMPVPVIPSETYRPPVDPGAPAQSHIAPDNDDRHRSDGDGSEQAQKRRRIVPPKERMVTRGVSAAQLASVAADTTPARASQGPSTPLTKHRGRPPLTFKSTPSSPKQHARLIRRDRPKALHSLKRTASHLGNGNARAEGTGDHQGYNLSAWRLRVHADPVVPLLAQSNKVLTTKDWQYAREEYKQMKLLRTIEALKADHSWSFTQQKRFVPPTRPKSHWDLLLDEMKWLREDFRQERRWRMAMAYSMALWVMEWHAAEDKASVCVSRRGMAIPQRDSPAATTSPPQDVAMADANPGNEESQETAAIENAHSSLQRPASPQRDYVPALISPDYDSSMFHVSDNWFSRKSDNSTYGPPVPDTSEVFIEGGSHPIIPVTKLMSEKRVAQDVYRWDEWGRPKEEFMPDEHVKSLPGNERYSNASVESAIFLPNEPSDTEERYRPAQPKTLPTKSVPWSSEEDEALLALVIEYKRNWDLVSEALRTARQRRNFYSRTAWECFERYNQITVGGSSSNTGTEPEVNGSAGPDVKPNINAKDGPSERSKPSKFFSTFDIIRKCAKKRDQKQQQSNGEKRPPNKITLAPHETHLNAQQQMNINPDQPLSPFQLSMLRENRTKELRHQDARHHQMHNYSRMAFSQDRLKMMSNGAPLIQTRPGVSYGTPGQMPMQHLGDAGALPQAGATANINYAQAGMNRVGSAIHMQQLQQQQQQQKQQMTQQFATTAQQAAAMTALNNAHNARNLTQGQNGTAVYSQPMALPNAASSVAPLPPQAASQQMPTNSAPPAPTRSPRFVPQPVMVSTPPVTAEVSQVQAAPSSSPAPPATPTTNGNPS
ncbi:chromatin modification- protein VID21 [Rhizophlyctis rosea]|uniref:Vacuolar import and degradation protein 21 n=1 Tax=Rhizophlyctis rosea TaxID=64517 RepID=A0AAD5SNF5_9FUNG|nr:chromatin modification- protein VID21 [Rhizophlyctis rosea]